jgi:hypothetical protein
MVALARVGLFRQTEKKYQSQSFIEDSAFWR